MAETIKGPRGVRDILPEESWKWRYVLEIARKVAEDFGYQEVHLPIFEHTELFSRGIGDTTDVVEKEMYTFIDKGNRSITLRPEGTASMMRSYLEQGMHKSPRQPAKLWCVGPMFRYERPQKGRYRQFWQLDFEAIGAKDPLVDVEIIHLSLEIYRRLGLRNLEVAVNSVGCPQCRPLYREGLRSFLEPRLDKFCPTCQGRYDRNPLRILDCKKEDCKNLSEEAPSVLEHLCKECREHFDMVCRGLEVIGIHYTLDKRLVRGLDYYTKTAYEVLSGDLGAQNAVCGGGRYDNLAESIGGPAVPGVGFAAGVERIVLTMEQQGCSLGEEPRVDVMVICPEPEHRLQAMEFLASLRKEGIGSSMDYTGKSMKSQLKSALQEGASGACILGGDELTRQVVGIKNFRTQEQKEVPLAEAVSYLRNMLGLGNS